MKKYFFYIVKYVRWIYSLYFYLGSFALKVLKCFVRPDEKLILFISFGGRKFDDSPRVIYDRMLNDARYAGYKLVWAFNNPDSFDIPRGEKVKCDTAAYFKTALGARVWISNSTVERGLRFKGKYTFYFDTWHGTPVKKMGIDVSADNKSFRSKNSGISPYDAFTVQSGFDAEVFGRAFNIPSENIKIIGLPRNDILANYSKEYVESLRDRLGLPKGKRVILYAPTFREYDKTTAKECVLKIPMEIEKWKSKLGDEYMLLFRAHYEVARGMNVVEDNFIKELSFYPRLEDLMIVSDILVSDYSSIFFDYSIMHKPMLSFCYDYDKYSSERGMYFDIREWLPNASDEDSLLDLIRNGDWNEFAGKTKAFQERFVTAFGSATEKSLDIIYDNLMNA